MKHLFLLLLFSIFAISMFSQISMSTIYVYSYNESGCIISRLDANSSVDYMSLTEESDTLTINAYPQIVENILNITIVNAEENFKADAAIYSIEGENVYHGTISTPQTEINISGYKSGIYILNVALNGQQKSFKFVKL